VIVEVRTYRIKPGLRDRFLAFFHRETAPLQRSIGMGIIGPFVDLDDPDVFIWLRTFPSAAAREVMKRELYEGERWKNELEAIAMPMLDACTVAVTTLTPQFVNDLASPAPTSR
jgi:hypothetical protein